MWLKDLAAGGAQLRPHRVGGTGNTLGGKPLRSLPAGRPPRHRQNRPQRLNRPVEEGIVLRSEQKGHELSRKDAALQPSFGIY